MSSPDPRCGQSYGQLMSYEQAHQVAAQSVQVDPDLYNQLLGFRGRTESSITALQSQMGEASAAFSGMQGDLTTMSSRIDGVLASFGEHMAYSKFVSDDALKQMLQAVGENKLSIAGCLDAMKAEYSQLNEEQIRRISSTELAYDRTHALLTELSRRQVQQTLELSAQTAQIGNAVAGSIATVTRNMSVSRVEDAANLSSVAARVASLEVSGSVANANLQHALEGVRSNAAAQVELRNRAESATRDVSARNASLATAVEELSSVVIPGLARDFEARLARRDAALEQQREASRERVHAMIAENFGRVQRDLETHKSTSATTHQREFLDRESSRERREISEASLKAQLTTLNRSIGEERERRDINEASLKSQLATLSRSIVDDRSAAVSAREDLEALQASLLQLKEGNPKAEVKALQATVQQLKDESTKEEVAVLQAMVQQLKKDNASWKLSMQAQVTELKLENESLNGKLHKIHDAHSAFQCKMESELSNINDSMKSVEKKFDASQAALGAAIAEQFSSLRQQLSQQREQSPPPAAHPSSPTALLPTAQATNQPFHTAKPPTSSEPPSPPVSDNNANLAYAIGPVPPTSIPAGRESSVALALEMATTAKQVKASREMAESSRWVSTTSWTIGLFNTDAAIVAALPHAYNFPFSSLQDGLISLVISVARLTQVIAGKPNSIGQYRDRNTESLREFNRLNDLHEVFTSYRLSDDPQDVAELSIVLRDPTSAQMNARLLRRARIITQSVSWKDFKAEAQSGRVTRDDNSNHDYVVYTFAMAKKSEGGPKNS